MTVTVALPNDNDRSAFHTHCIALGSKGGDHHKLIVSKLEELEAIWKGKLQFDARQGKWVNTSFDVIVYMADRPERSEIIRALSFKGISTKRFQYAAHVRDTAKLPACNKCFADMVSNVYNDDCSRDISGCKGCCNWHFSDDRHVWQSGKSSWKYVSLQPENYPMSVSQSLLDTIGIPDGREVDPKLAPYIKPHEQDFKWMKNGAELALAEVSEGNWGKTQARQYLKSMGICTQVEDDIVQLGENRHKKKHKANEMDESNARGTKRKADNMYDTEKDSVIPAIWSKGYDIDMFLECPMHCKFIVKFNVASYWQ